jgi:hypothetical protein
MTKMRINQKLLNQCTDAACGQCTLTLRAVAREASLPAGHGHNLGGVCRRPSH